MIKITRGNCSDVLPALEDKSVDIVFYDPPYNVGKKYDGFSDKLELETYVEWMKQVACESERISKRGVLIYVAGKLTKLFYDILPDAHLIIIEKRAAGVASNNYMLQYHSLFSTVKPIIKCRDVWNDIRLPGEGYYFREPRYENPGQTGLELTKKILHHFTNDGDVVLDPFAGVGTTLVACKEMNRNGIGIEQSKKYIRIANERLSI